MKELKETIALMQSDNYKDRFAAEFYQLETRYLKLSNMLFNWDNGNLNFTPDCPKEIYVKQLSYMREYLYILSKRAKLENIELDASVKFEEGYKPEF